jgi:hypothetical protein
MRLPNNTTLCVFFFLINIPFINLRYCFSQLAKEYDELAPANRNAAGYAAAVDALSSVDAPVDDAAEMDKLVRKALTSFYNTGEYHY